MRLNKYLSQTTHLSRRKADEAIVKGRVTVNENTATIGQSVQQTDVVELDGNLVSATKPITTLIFNKPVGYVCSRTGQGSKTIYDLLPEEYKHLNYVGRLDKDSSGLLLLTNDGELTNKLSHPRYQKEKVYEVTLDKTLPQKDKMRLMQGIELDDGPSNLHVETLDDTNNSWIITMQEGRNRQIRRTFEKLGYKVAKLHRTSFGEYELANLKPKEFKKIS